MKIMSKYLVVMLLAGLLLIPAYAHDDHNHEGDFVDQFSDSVTITEVDCTLESGEESTCYQIETIAFPDGIEIGPFCPETADDDDAGIWVWDGEDPAPGLYQVTGAFFELLDSIGYDFVNADGTINIADPGAGGGARANGGNTCLEATADESVEITALIPMNPVMADRVTNLGTVALVGVALDGVTIFADAPSVLNTGGLPALDLCGGHIDPGGFYHWHFHTTDIDNAYDEAELDLNCINVTQDAAGLFGYAYDGFPMYGSLSQDGTVPEDLDECGGHFGITAEYPDGIYHYHASTEAPNLPECLVGVQAVNNFSTTASTGIGANGGQGGGPGGEGGRPEGGPPGGGQGGRPEGGPPGGGEGAPPQDGQGG
ncbi:MAG: YHYH protein [Aggregatilineales bacterium]